MNIVTVHLAIIDRHGRRRRMLTDEHLSVMSGERPWLTAADVIIYAGHPTQIFDNITDLLTGHPGCLVAAAPAQTGYPRHPGPMWVIGTRDGQRAVCCGPEPWWIASVMHAWIVAGRQLSDLTRMTVMTHAIKTTGVIVATGMTRATGATGMRPGDPEVLVRRDVAVWGAAPADGAGPARPGVRTGR